MYIYITYILIKKGMIMHNHMTWHNHTLFIMHILTYYDFLRTLLFLEI